MPRDGANTYAPPAGTLATSNTTISSSAYNAFVADLTADANAARPVTAGGTGATTAAAARNNLGATATGNAVFTASDAAAARTAIGAPAVPVMATGVGQVVNLFQPDGTAIVLPSGGSWLYKITFYTAAGAYASSTAGVAAGGATVTGPDAIKDGFAWRVA